MILLKPDQLAEFVEFVQERGERMVIVVTPERIEVFMVPEDGAQSLAEAAQAWAAG